MAKRTDPITRCRRYGMATLPSGRKVFITQSGLLIGCRHVQAPARDLGVHAERLQASLWGRRPLSVDQVWVAALCVAGRRP